MQQISVHFCVHMDATMVAAKEIILLVLPVLVRKGVYDIR